MGIPGNIRISVPGFLCDRSTWLQQDSQPWKDWEEDTAQEDGARCFPGAGSSLGILGESPTSNTRSSSKISRNDTDPMDGKSVSEWIFHREGSPGYPCVFFPFHGDTRADSPLETGAGIGQEFPNLLQPGIPKSTIPKQGESLKWH